MTAPRTSASAGQRLAARRSSVGEHLGETGADALLVTDLRNVAYLTGFRGSAGVALVEADGRTVLATDSRYEVQVAEQAPDVERIITREYVPAVLERRSAGPDSSVAVEADQMTLAAATALRRALAQSGDGTATVVETTGLVERSRRVKDAAELDTIGSACRVADEAWTGVLATGAIRAGRTEREVAADLELAMRRAGSDGVSFDTIVASGPNGALPHHVPGDRVLTDGDLVVVDFGALVQGYASDCTRTVGIGALPDALVRIHALTLRAQLAGVDAVGPGIACRDLDAVSRGVIAEGGHGEHFGHSLGHGVGLDVHEAPAVSANSTGTLCDGDVITVEPGIYLPGRGGVRIEDTVAVTSDGRRVLTATAKDLRVL